MTKTPSGQVRGKVRTEKIVQVAAKMFLARGFDLTNLDDVIEAAGGSKAHLYRSFRNKEGLFLACVEYLCDQIQASVETPAVTDLPLREGLLRLSHSLVKVLLGKQHLAFQRLVFAETSRFPRAGELWFRHGPLATKQIFQTAIQQWMDKGELRAGDAGLIADLLCDMLTGHLLDRTWLGISNKQLPGEPETTVTAAVQLIVQGFGC